MGTAPRLTIGLPVYNGARYIEQALDALLGQSFEDFRLVISDNASTDETGEICKRYAKRDSRIDYFRQRRNIGLSPNHNFTLDRADTELFKWASHDDLYAKDLLKSCVAALDEYPEMVQAHSWTAHIDDSNNLIDAEEYPLLTSSSRPSERFRSILFDFGGDDDYGVMRTTVLRSVKQNASHHHAGRTLVAEIVLRGPFYQVPKWLYFRRYHEDQAEFKHAGIRENCINMDPRRANGLLNPAMRLYAEYAWGYVSAINRSPLSPVERRECYRHLIHYLINRAGGKSVRKPVLQSGTVPMDADFLVAGLETKR